MMNGHINEPIMRRGLSPEGQRIRQRHQSSLLNDEGGVTCLPIHRIIEKDFLKENIMRLKEIQAKCRVQETRPISGNHPVKALRTKMTVLPIKYSKDDSAVLAENEVNPTETQRGSSAHSDYFSLSDEALIEPVVFPIKPSFSYDRELVPINGRGENSTEKSICNNISEKVEGESPHLMSNNGILRYRSKSNNNLQGSNCCLSPKNFNETYTILPSYKISSTKFGDFYPHISTSRGKLVSLIEKIKNKKPACDSGTNKIWQDIEMQHKALFIIEEPYSVYNTINCDQESVKSSVKLNSTNQENKVTVNRSHSLDRYSYFKRNHKGRSSCITNHPLDISHSKAKSFHDLDSGLKSTLSPVVKEMGNLEVSSHSVIQAGSLPNLYAKKHLSEHPSITQTLNKKIDHINNDYILGNDSLPMDHGSFENDSVKENEMNSNDFTKENDLSFSESHLVEPFLAASNANSFAKETKQPLCHYPETKTESLLSASPNFNDVHRHFDSSEAIKVHSPEGDGDNKYRFSTPIITKRETSSSSPKQNALAKQRIALLRSKSTSNLQLAGEPPPTYKRGHIPRYLLARKAETQRQQEAAAAIDPLCPPGHTPIPDHERRNTLHLLKKGLAETMQQMSALPVAQDTLRVRKLKQELEAKLSQIEEGIEIFSQPKVYVIND